MPYFADQSEAADKKRKLNLVIQGQVEATVLQQPNGSVTQRILAEYLSELMQRVEQFGPKDEEPPKKDLTGLF